MKALENQLVGKARDQIPELIQDLENKTPDERRALAYHQAGYLQKKSVAMVQSLAQTYGLELTGNYPVAEPKLNKDGSPKMSKDGTPAILNRQLNQNDKIGDIPGYSSKNSGNLTNLIYQAVAYAEPDKREALVKDIITSMQTKRPGVNVSEAKAEGLSKQQILDKVDGQNKALNSEMQRIFDGIPGFKESLAKNKKVKTGPLVEEGTGKKLTLDQVVQRVEAGGRHPLSKPRPDEVKLSSGQVKTKTPPKNDVTEVKESQKPKEEEVTPPKMSTSQFATGKSKTTGTVKKTGKTQTQKELEEQQKRGKNLRKEAALNAKEKAEVAKVREKQKEIRKTYEGKRMTAEAQQELTKLEAKVNDIRREK